MDHTQKKSEKKKKKVASDMLYVWIGCNVGLYYLAGALRGDDSYVPELFPSARPCNDKWWVLCSLHAYSQTAPAKELRGWT